MFHLQISEELHELLRTTASDHAVTPAELLDALISAHIEDRADPLTDEQVSLLTARMAQLDHGESISSEQVDIFFEDLFKKLDQKAAREAEDRGRRGVFLREPRMVEIEVSESLRARLDAAPNIVGQTAEEFTEDAILATLSREELRAFHLTEERNRESPLQLA